VCTSYSAGSSHDNGGCRSLGRKKRIERFIEMLKRGETIYSQGKK
jgi:hypothetical protein